MRAFTVIVCAFLLFFGGEIICLTIVEAQIDSTAQKSSVSATATKKKKKRRRRKKTVVDTTAKKTSVAKSKKKTKIVEAPKKTIAITPPSNLKPTMTGAPGTVKSYFFPDRIGAEWTMRTIQLLIDKDNKILRADTLYAQSRVVDTARFSLQRLPVMVTSDTSYKSTGKGVRTESLFYVDDSIAMTVFNNSISSAENRVFLVTPLKLRNAWHEKFEDSIVTMIAGFGDSVMTPIGRFDHVLVTLTQEDYSDMRKYYAPGHGIIKTVFRSVAPGGNGLIIVTTEMIAFKKPD
jgi:hypothetical protein